MKTDSAAPKITDFSRTNVNHWSVNCSVDDIYNYFKYLRGHLEWFETDGKTVLEQAEPLTREQFELIVDGHLYHVITDIPKLKPLNTFLQIVLKKGISSLKTLVENSQISRGEIEEYLKTIMRYLEGPAPCGVYSHECSNEDSVAMIDSLVPIAQACMSEDMLERISRCRFPGRTNGLPREIFVKHFKNWTDHVKVHASSLGPYSPQNPHVCIHCGKSLEGVPLDEPCNSGKPTQ